ncbi:PXMP2/4 family protein 4-like [Chrysoperla carnea]|uniref:PXMP2/4 family protein 4-like n=1 Tax=Chrysoperla carnea TaxID=189513 RepID=UPI001D093253|nr:PXMP2/4 family protein 4-like [Chrysoperla carnea]
MAAALKATPKLMQKLSMLAQFKIFTTKHPIVRGMISYSIIWPTSNIIQQTILGRRWDTYDWMEALRFSIYGGLYVAPTLYSWIRIAGIAWPKSDFKTAVTKAIVEQFSYTPFAMVSFFFGISILEMKSFREACEEVRVKFFPTYQIGAAVWPFVATFNFCVIPERNRVVFISMCSLCWTCFLAYMKHLQATDLEKNPSIIHIS